jgi:hypothetical protein
VRDSLVARIDSWSPDSAPGVIFAGFEPFAHPELPQLIEAAVNSGFVRVALRTDAGALGLPGNAAGVIAAGVRALEVMLLGGTAAEHDGATAAPGLFDAATVGVAAFRSAARDAGVHVSVSGFVPVCRHNEAFAAGGVAALASMGATSVELACASQELAEKPEVRAALETAAVNGMAAWRSVSGAVLGGDQAPWVVSS